MKLKAVSRHLKYSLSMVGLLSSMISFQSHAGAMGPVAVSAPGKVYVGVFGGGGKSSSIDISQYATAFFEEAVGGPLAVNIFGETDKRSRGFLGAHVGYQWPEILLSSNLLAAIVPAFELEGFYLGKTTFKGHEVNNDTYRLPEHNFNVTYPMKARVFLTNALINFNLGNLTRLHPYVGGGIGGALISINHAQAIQIAPPELGINHYNASTSDREATFAGQVKTGLNVDITKNIAVFAEYRWLYLASGNFPLGSTVYPNHAPTSGWLVKLGSQTYNMGAVGLHLSV